MRLRILVKRLLFPPRCSEIVDIRENLPSRNSTHLADQSQGLCCTSSFFRFALQSFCQHPVFSPWTFTRIQHLFNANSQNLEVQICPLNKGHLVEAGLVEFCQKSYSLGGLLPVFRWLIKKEFYVCFQ